MNIATVSAAHFCRFSGVYLHLPASGVVVVRGDNGSGKSSLYEAVAWGLWGETVRGSRVRNVLAGTAPTVCVALHDGAMVRRDGKGLDVGDGVKYPTVTKAQANLIARLGWTFEEWAMTQVFSASNPAACFSRMKPSERIEALETLLGLSVLDNALAMAREELRTVERMLAKLTTQETLQREEVARAQARLAAGALHMEATAPARPRQDPELQAKIKAAEDALSAAADKANQALRHARVAKAGMERARSDLERAREPLATACPTCKREHDNVEEALAHWKLVLEEAEEQDADAQTYFSALVMNYNKHNVAANACQESLDALREEWDLNESAWSEYDFAQAHNARIDATLEQELGRIEETLDETLADKRAALREQATLALVVKTLGTAGVRAKALEGFLDAFSRAANVWLARLSRGAMSLACAIRTTPSGKQEVELAIEGVAGGEGYKGASTGEQRRIDLALLFALSDIAAKAKGASLGTLWVDEVFDTLDEGGREACAEVIEDIARERCVVVITHEDAVAGMFGTVAKHITVREGELE